MKKDKLLLSLILRAVGIAFCILPVTLAVLSYFPLWKSCGADEVICGFTALLLVLAFHPLYNLIKKAVSTVASYTVWLIAFIIFLLLSRIADEMTVISFIGFVGNSIGAILMKIGEGLRGSEK